MRQRIRSLLGLAVLLLLTGTLAMSQDNVFTCSSDDGQMHSCRVNSNGPIQFVRQRSDAQCIAGETYGINRRSVWVTNGCQADFAVMNGDQAYNQGTYNNGYYNGQYGDRDRDNDHDADDQGTWRERHHDRDRDRDRDRDNGYYDQNGGYNGTYNNGPYNNGPYDRTGSYQGSYNGYGNQGHYQGPYYGSYKNGVTECSSRGQAQTYCQTNGPLSDATVINQNGSCQRGRTWDITPDGLWVAGGCSGKFQIQR